MSGVELISELTDICIRQAEIIKAQAYVLEQFGAEVMEEERLKEVLNRAMQEVQKHQSGPKFLLIKSGGAHRRIPVEDILYVENNGRKVIVHTGKEKLEYYERMNHLEEVLGEGFYRCHRGYLVAFSAVSGYDNTSITVNTGDKIYLAKQKYSEFVKLYCRFLKE